MALLTGKRIRQEIEAGRIVVTPHDETLLKDAGVSLDVRMGERLLRARSASLFVPGADNSANFVEDRLLERTFSDDPLPPDVRRYWELLPGDFYLASILETVHTPFYATDLRGKSTNARASLVVHQTAGLGEPGFSGNWTMELTVTRRCLVWPGMKVAQITFSTVEGEVVSYNGRYQDQQGPTPGRVERPVM